MLRRTIAIATLMVGTLTAPQSRAATPPLGKSATAEALSRKGMVQLEAGDYDAACENLRKSLELELAMGVMFSLGTCYEKSGKTASAQKIYRKAAKVARAADMSARAAEANAAADALEPRIPKLVIEVPAEIIQLDRLSIERNGKPVLRKDWGAAVSLDPGVQQIQVTATGHKPWKSRSETSEGKTTTVNIGPLESLAPAPAEIPTDVILPTNAYVSYEKRRTSDVLLPIGIAWAGLGAASLGVGIALSLIGKNDNQGANCEAGMCDSYDDVKKQYDSMQLGNIATAVSVVGGTLMAGGATMIMVALLDNAEEENHAEAEAGVQVGIGLGGIQLQGQW